MFDSFRHLRKSLNSFLYRYVPPSGECAWSMKVSVRRIAIREGSWKSAANQPQTAAANNCAIRNKMPIKSNDLLRNMITFLGYHTVCAENSGFQLFTARRLYRPRPRPTYSVVRRYMCFRDNLSVRLSIVTLDRLYSALHRDDRTYWW